MTEILTLISGIVLGIVSTLYIQTLIRKWKEIGSEVKE